MIQDPYTPIQNPLAPEPFNPFNADQGPAPAQTPQPTAGSDGTQMQPSPSNG
jgi:hypothetical protein